MKEIHKGTHVLVRALAHTTVEPWWTDKTRGRLVYRPERKDYSPRRKSLYSVRCMESYEALVCGYTYLATGYYYPGHDGGYVGEGYEYAEPGELAEDKRHKVWAVIAFRETDRYFLPDRALEEDLEVLDEGSSDPA
jgi:hypothetical protein